MSLSLIAELDEVEISNVTDVDTSVAVVGRPVGTHVDGKGDGACDGTNVDGKGEGACEGTQVDGKGEGTQVDGNGEGTQVEGNGDGTSVLFPLAVCEPNNNMSDICATQ
jgi:hypothetical protein